MGYNDNYGLPASTVWECPNCKSAIRVSQNWVRREPDPPPPCPVCGVVFLTLDDGIRTDSRTGRKFKRDNRVQYYRVAVVRRGPRDSASTPVA